MPTINELIDEVNLLKKLIINIRSQTRILHTGLHQPVDSAVWQSLHHVTHKQISYINEADEQVKLIKIMLVNIMLFKKMAQPQIRAKLNNWQSGVPLLDLLGLTANELESIGDDLPV